MAAGGSRPGGRGAALMAKILKAQQAQPKEAPGAAFAHVFKDPDPFVQTPDMSREDIIEMQKNFELHRVAQRRAKAAAAAAEAASSSTDASSDSPRDSFSPPDSTSPDVSHRPSPLDFEAHRSGHRLLHQDLMNQISVPVVVPSENRASSSGYSTRRGPMTNDSTSSYVDGAFGGTSSSSRSGPPSSDSSHSSGSHNRERIQFVEGDLQKMRIEEQKIVSKGEGGTPIKMEANYVEIKIGPNAGFFEYDVRFEPELDNRNARFVCLGKLKDTVGKARTFDGSKLCLPFQLPDKVTRCLSSYTPNFPEVWVTITYKAKRSYEDQNAIHMYNILFRRIMAVLKFVEWNRNHYDPRKARYIDELKLEVWPGYVTAVRSLEDGLYLVCDVSSRVLRSETVLGMMGEIYAMQKHYENKNNGKTFDVQSEIKRNVFGQSVLTRYNNKHYRVDDIDFKSSPKETFTDSHGNEVSYIDYYRKQYNIVLKDIDQPLLLSRPKKINPQDKERTIALIPELCHLTGISEDTRNDHRKMKTIYNYIQSNPGQRSLAVKKFVASVKDSPECCEILAEWGLELASAAIMIDGRRMDNIKLVHGNNSTSLVDNGDFSRQLKSNKMYQCCPLERWIIVCPGSKRYAAQEFDNMFFQESKKLGMMVAPPNILILNSDRTEEYIKAIMQNCTPQHKTQLILAIFPTKRSDKYAAIKKLCYTELGIPSQVMQSSHMDSHKMKKAQSVVYNIGMQINAKLGGEVWGCKSPYTNAMVVGIDVYHDPDNKNHSWSGFVASLNPYFTRWTSHTRKHDSACSEMIDKMQDMFREALQQYKNVNHELPDRIIVYRDGVGDGRLEFTKEFELEQLKTACTAFGGNYRPPITMVIVSKRIATRMLEIDPRSGERGNPKPGSVLDHKVTKKEYVNFFLVSQKVNQGTVSPTHYIVISDGIGMGATKIQILTYRLCHMYVNWAGPVRVPAPCLYAHKLAGQIGEFVKKDPSMMDHKILFYI